MKLIAKMLATGSILCAGTVPSLMQSATAKSSGAGQLTLFSKQNQSGERRVITGSEADLTSLGANNFAWSLSAIGNWEICMDPGFRAGCRVVTGTISDLATDGGAISSARHLGASGATTAAAKPAASSAAQAGAEQAYVYSTVGFGEIRPELVFDELGAATSGTYTATQSEAELDAIYRTGTYGITNGTVEGQMSGNMLTGYWYESATNAGLQVACDVERNGTFIYGRFTLTFSADRKSFSGFRSSCDVVPDAVEHKYYTWTGKLTRRQTAATPTGSTSKARMAGGSSGPKIGILDNAARAAEGEANAKAEEMARRAVRGILGQVLGD